MKPLSRAFARLVLLFFALGIFFLAVNELIPYRTLGDRYRVMDTAYWIKNTLRITGIVLLVNGGIQWVRNLRCPYCGRGYAMPWWRKGEKHFCDRCGREIVFDDPEDPTEKRKGEYSTIAQERRCPYCGGELAPGGSGAKATKGPSGSRRAASCPAFC